MSNLHPFLGIQVSPGKVIFLNYNLENSVVPKINIMDYKIGDPGALWFKVQSIKEAEEIVFSKSKEHRLLRFNDLMNRVFWSPNSVRGNPTNGHIHWMISSANMLARENRRGRGNIWVSQKETFHRVLDSDTRNLSWMFNSNELVNSKYIGSPNWGDSHLVQGDVELDYVYQFYKGSEIDACGYITTDELNQMYLCLPIKNDFSDIDMYLLYTRALEFDLNNPVYLEPILNHFCCDS